MSSYEMAYCTHLDCGFGNRLEYCTPAAAEQDSSAAMVADMLEEVLYGNMDRAAARVEYRDGVVEYNLSYVAFESLGGVRRQVNRTLRIWHDVSSSPQKEYDFWVRTGWSLPNRVGGGEFAIDYSLRRYGAGVVQACMAQPSLETGAWDTTYMTDYDCGQLFDELGQAQDTQKDARLFNAFFGADG